ncbi:universal stress protein [Maribacter sp. ACAM166]|uniref:universal stress protein n=1 Tax=Maribacter sp. ACAM166 TaxID=2508996 RepID=UPI0010FF3ED5|nr:universal stress protein [Maribacter sp. ACAM166]TLP77285.1 universal stress protein [Maribacter sp. ACAM166]
MNKILVPVDFSECSENALKISATIANAQITVLRKIGLSEAVFTKDENQEFIEAQYYMKLAKKHFDSFLDKPYLKGLKIETMVQNYKIFSEINEIVKSHEIDLVIMGSHGLSGVKNLFVGSNTEKVVRTSEFPVLVIKENIPDFTIEKIVMAWHYKDEKVSSYRKAKAFADIFKAKLYLVYVNLPTNDFLSTNEIEERTSIFMQNYGDNIDVGIYDDYSVEDGLIHYAEKINADVIAVPTHGRKGLSHFFLGSTGESLANNSNLPVLTFKI